MVSNKTTFRTFHIEPPIELIRVHKELERVYHSIMKDENIIKDILSIDWKTPDDRIKHRGIIWMELNKISSVREKTDSMFPEWLRCPSWYRNILFEQIRRDIQSLYESQTIYDILQKHADQNDGFWSEIRESKIYPTAGKIRNLSRSKVRPSLPKRGNFVLDYSCGNKALTPSIEQKEDYILYRVNWHKGQDPIAIKVVLPLSIREQCTGKTAKLRVYHKNGTYRCDVPYEVLCETPNGTNRLGVDIGKVKLFSASALYSNGATSQELLPSGKLMGMVKKLDTLYTQKSMVGQKENDFHRLGDKVPNHIKQKSINRQSHYLQLSTKIIQLKEQIAWLVARELVDYAKEYNCNRIHLEDLRWLDARGGKWNHSFTQAKIEELAEVAGIAIVYVSARGTSSEHPVTRETGKPSGREIVFLDGERIDRDQLGSLNIGKREDKSRGYNKIASTSQKVTKINKSSPKKKRNSTIRSRKMAELLKLKQEKDVAKMGAYAPIRSTSNCTGIEGWFFVYKETSNTLLNSGHIFIKTAALPSRWCQI